MFPTKFQIVLVPKALFQVKNPQKFAAVGVPHGTKIHLLTKIPVKSPMFEAKNPHVLPFFAPRFFGAKGDLVLPERALLRGGATAHPRPAILEGSRSERPMAIWKMDHEKWIWIYG